MVSRILPSNQTARGLFLAGLKDVNLYPEVGCVSFICVLYCVVSVGGPHILLTTDSGGPPLCIFSVLVQRLCSSYRHLTQRISGVHSGR